MKKNKLTFIVHNPNNNKEIVSEVVTRTLIDANMRKIKKLLTK